MSERAVATVALVGIFWVLALTTVGLVYGIAMDIRDRRER